MQGGEEIKGENWENCNGIINKKYFKKGLMILKWYNIINLTININI